MKNGFKSQKQKYLCKSCGKQFVFRQNIDNQVLYDDYIFGKQTLKQLSRKYKNSVRTVQRRLSEIGSEYVIVKQYLTQNPELEASIELLSIVKQLCYTDKESFIGMFEQWVKKWSIFLKERRVEPRTGKTRYVHSRLRSAYLSLKRNMPYLWTWYDNMWNWNTQYKQWFRMEIQRLEK